MTECVFVCVRQREKYFCTADSKQMDAAYSASSFLYVVILLSPSQKYKTVLIHFFSVPSLSLSQNIRPLDTIYIQRYTTLLANIS